MNYFNIIEFIIIIIYLYGLIFLTINIKPTILSLSIIFLYTLISTWLLYNKHCRHKLIKYNKKRLLFTIIYSIFCCLCYIFLYYSYKKYNDFLLYKILLFCIPLNYYFLNMYAENILKCRKNYFIKFILDKITEFRL